MKKLLIGCLVILVLCAIAAGVVSYFLYRAASPLIEDARNYVQGMSQLDEIERQLVNKAPYTGPASGELTEAQVERFVRVQQSMRKQLGQRMREIEQKYDDLRSHTDTSAQVSFTQLLSGLRDITGVYVDARR
jgi:uncharacterized protein (DUF3084 family)